MRPQNVLKYSSTLHQSYIDDLERIKEDSAESVFESQFKNSPHSKQQSTFDKRIKIVFKESLLQASLTLENLNDDTTSLAGKEDLNSHRTHK